MAKFRKGDKVESVKTGAKGVVDEVYGEEKYAVLFDGAATTDKVEGFQIKAANGCARNAKFKMGDQVLYRGVFGGRREDRIGTVRSEDSPGKYWVVFFDGSKMLIPETSLEAKNACAPRSSNSVVQNAINACGTARNAGDLSGPFQSALSAVRKLAEEAKKIRPDHEVYKDAVKAGTALLRMKPNW